MQDAKPIAQHGQPPARVPAGGLEQREQIWRQAGGESQSGPGVDVQAVTLPPAGQGRVPLIHGDVGAGPQQPLGQAQAAEASAGHRHPKTAHRPCPS